MRTNREERSKTGRMIAVLLAAGLVLAVVACSDDTTPPPADGAVTTDGPVGAPDKTVPKTDGTPPKKDKGTPKVDKGTPKVDKGTPKVDKGTPPPVPKCIPNFGAKDACASSLVGKWKYKSGCVSPVSFDAIKKTCPGAKVSNTGYTMDGGVHTLVMKADGTFTRAVKGKATGKVFVPASCAVLGCAAVVTAAKLLFPSGAVTCKAAAGGGCECNVTLPIATLDQGKYKTAGGKCTATVNGKNYEYYYCAKSGALRYRGTGANSYDNIVSYVLTK